MMRQLNASKKWFLGLALLILPLAVGGQAVPQANLRITPTTGDLNTTFVLDASDSRSAQGANGRLEYRFKAGRNGPSSPFQSQSSFRFRATKTGSFTAQVEVRDTLSGAMSTTYHRYTVRQESQRDFRVTASNLNPVAGEKIDYQVTVFGNNIDRNNLEVRWDFNSDGRFDTPWQRSLVASTTAFVGQTSPTVEVRFPDGQILRTRNIFTTVTTPTRQNVNNQQRTPIITRPNPLKAPILEVRALRQPPREGTGFVLDGSNTQRTSGSYLEWIIEGKTIRNRDKLNYQFSAAGDKTITLRHCINQAQPYCLESSTTVNIAPQPLDQYADILWYNQTDRGRPNTNLDYARVASGDTLRFTARILGQRTPEQKYQYRWDFNGDGLWDTNFTDQASAEHTFNEAGEFVTVLEALPQFTSRNFTRLEHVLPVYVERNRSPQGEFGFKQENNYVGEKVYYTAEVYDPESNQQVEVRFDSDADGVWDSAFRRQLSWWWVYDAPGEYLVRLQLRDPQGRVKEVKQTVNILPMPEPVAKVTVSHRTQAVKKTILLDAGNSLGRELTYEWRVIGQPKLRLPASRRASLRLEEGDYTIGLTIRDRLGVEDTLMFPVSFMPPEQVAAPPETQNNGTERPPNLLRLLPGAPRIDNYILPPEGVPQGPSPFVVDAGGQPVRENYISNMRAIR